MKLGQVDSVSHVHYSSRELKKIFARQILNREHEKLIQAESETNNDCGRRTF